MGVPLAQGIGGLGPQSYGFVRLESGRLLTAATRLANDQVRPKIDQIRDLATRQLIEDDLDSLFSHGLERLRRCRQRRIH